jgi:hypothetical protein
MAKQKEFNQDIWHELLILEQSCKKKGTPLTLAMIEEKFELENWVARAYRFALLNREFITSSLLEHKKMSKLQVGVKETNKKVAKLEEQLLLEEDRANFAIGLTETEPVIIPIKISNYNPNQSECVAATIFSDLHYEEKVELDAVGGLNEYNLEIANERAQRYFSRLLWKINSSRLAGYKIKKLFLQVLGDLITGHIHKENISANLSTPTEAILDVESILLSGIKYLLDNGDFEEIVVVMIPGNHGRNTEKLYHVDAYKYSYEYMMYKRIERLINDGFLGSKETIKIIVPKSVYAYTEIYNKIYRSSHGNHFKYVGGVGGLYIPLMRHILKSSQQKRFDRAYFGHWHTCFSLPECGSNGSVIGLNPYSFDLGFSAQEPQQLYELIDSEKGIIEFSPILLNDKKSISSPVVKG